MKFALLILTFGFQCVLGVESDPQVFPPCSLLGKIDLQLIVDSSYSVGNTNFKLMLQEIADDLIGQFDIGKDKTRVSLFKYSNVMKEEFDLDAYTDAASLKKAIKAVEYEGGSTYTGEAMEKALAHYSAKMRKEKETAKVCIVLTDGEAHDAAKIPAALKAWGNKGVTVFALGIGKKLKDTGLEAITGSKDQIIKVADFNAIGKAANSLLAKVCKAIPTKPDNNLDEKIQELQEMILHLQEMIKNVICGVNADDIDSRSQIVYDGTAGGLGTNLEEAFKSSSRPSDRWWSENSLPAKIWYNFTSPVRVVKISFKSPYDIFWKQVPKKFKLIASNDCTNWHVLLTVTNSAFTKSSQVMKWRIPCERQKSYYCYGIEATEHSGYGTWSGVSLSDMRMFQKSEC